MLRNLIRCMPDGKWLLNDELGGTENCCTQLVAVGWITKVCEVGMSKDCLVQAPTIDLKGEPAIGTTASSWMHWFVLISKIRSVSLYF